MAQILSGKEPAAIIKQQVKEAIQKEGLKPGLGIVFKGDLGDDTPAARYVRNKVKDCAEVGIYTKVVALDKYDNRYVDYIEDMNGDPSIHGIIVQLPLPDHMDTRQIINTILPEKDVDGLTQANIGRLWEGKPLFKPCTPAAVMELLEHYGYELDGTTWGNMNVVILGRSDIVGKPLAAMMLQANATVTVCHSHTPSATMCNLLENADIIVSAVGGSNIHGDVYTVEDVDLNDFNQQVIFIDVGITTGKDGKLYGDIDPECYTHPNCEAYTPVPGGIGPMTRAILLKNVLQAARLQK